MEKRRTRLPLLAVLAVALAAVVGLAPRTAWAEVTALPEAQDGVITLTDDSAQGIAGPAVARIGNATYPSLELAFSAANNGDTVAVVGDVSDSSSQVEITNKAVVLDLAGHTLTSTTAWTPITVNGAGAKLTIVDSSSSGAGTLVSTNADPVIQVTHGELDFQSGTIRALDSWRSTNQAGESALFGADVIRVYGSDDSSARNYSVVRVGAGATIENVRENTQGQPIGSGYGIDVNHDGAGDAHAYGVVVEFSGKTENSGMYVNGSIADATGNVPTLTLNEGAVIDGMIYAAGYANWDIRGAEITGETGMEIRAGSLTMSAGSITGNGTPTEVLPNGNGSTTSGAGLAIAQHTTKLPISVRITGGTISGYTALYESTPEKDANASVNLSLRLRLLTDRSTQSTAA